MSKQENIATCGKYHSDHPKNSLKRIVKPLNLNI